MTPADLGAYLAARIPGAMPTTSYDELTVEVPLPAWVDAARLCATDPAVACTFFDWLSAVDEGEAIAVVTHLYSPALRHHVRLRTRVPSGASVPSLTPVFRGASWHERETQEMFGVPFTGAGAAGPLLLPPGEEAAPLRKDFTLASRDPARWPGLVEPGDRA